MADVNDVTPNLATENTNDVTRPPVITGINHLKLTGQLDILHDNITTADRNASLTMASNDVGREIGVQTLQPIYYIRIPHNINSAIQFHTGDTNDAQRSEAPGETFSSDSNDDSWEMSAITVLWNDGDSTAGHVRSLPYADATNKVAEFTVQDPSNLSKVYGLDLQIVLGNDGAITSNASLNDSTAFTGVIDDNFQLAQNAYWPFNDGTNININNAGESRLNNNEEDRLAATITSTQILTHFTATGDISGIESDVNDMNNILNGYQISFEAQAADTDSNLSKFGQGKYVNDATLFTTGERIVASQPQLYTVTLNATLLGGGTEYTLVNDYVYGVLEQN